MIPRRLVRFSVLAALGLVATAISPASTGAQAATPRADASVAPQVTSTIQVVADGLNAPRKVIYDPASNRLLVAEAGVLAQDTGPCGFAERHLPFCLGLSGSVLQYSIATGQTQRIITGLPSAGLQVPGLTVVIGLHDLSLREDRLYGVFGLLGPESYRDSLGPGAKLMGQEVTFTDEGQARSYADLIHFEDNGLYGSDKPEGDPYGLTTGPFGSMVANAGGPGFEGNDVLMIDNNKRITQIAQFPRRPLTNDPSRTIASVPTAMAQGPDGAFYVGELTGTPFTPGEARIYRIVPGQAPTIYAQGLTLITDLTFDEQGRMIVLETAQDDPFDTDQNGTLIRIEPDGTRTVLASDGMKNPGGVASAGNGVFYVTAENASGGGVGKLLKIQVTG